VWTGFDYRGEPQKFSWPSVSSVFGIMDTCGFPKTAFYMHQAAWIDDKPVVQIVPHWNWPGKEGKPVKVLVLTNGDAAELFLNGKSLGEKPVDRLEGGEWEVPYAPGKLEAVAKKAGKVIARTSVETTGEPVAIKLVPDRKDLAGDGADAQPLTVSAIDAKGRDVPTANLPVTFAISGPGTIIGHGNGDPTSHESEKGPTRNLFNGLAQVIVQSKRDTAGTIVLTATSPGLKPVEVRLEVRKVAPIPAVPPTDPVFSLAKWNISPVSKVKPDAGLKPGETDMNSWEAVNVGGLQSIPDGSWAVYRTEFTPFESVIKSGGLIDFKQIDGLAEIWLDGRLAGEKKDPKPAGLRVPLPAGPGKHSLAVLIQGVQKGKAGFSKPVIVTPAKR
jgi:beta-galactosidase